MRLYVNYKRSQKADSPTHQARNVSALQGRGYGRQGRGGRGRGGRGGLGGHMSGGVPQEEVNKVTIVEAWYYSPEDYAKFAFTKKQKYFQLMRAMKAAAYFLGGGDWEVVGRLKDEKRGDLAINPRKGEKKGKLYLK
jgi:hypothetical protein